MSQSQLRNTSLFLIFELLKAYKRMRYTAKVGNSLVLEQDNVRVKLNITSNFNYNDGR